MAADLVATHTMMDHIGRYLPSVRMNGAAFSFVVDLIINYGSPVLHLVMVSGQRGDVGVWRGAGEGLWCFGVLWGFGPTPLVWLRRNGWVLRMLVCVLL